MDEQSRRVARNTVRNVLAGSDPVGKMTILRDVLADLQADGVHVGRLLTMLEAEAARQTPPPEEVLAAELAAGAHLVVRRVLPVSEHVEGPTVLDTVHDLAVRS